MQDSILNFEFDVGWSYQCNDCNAMQQTPVRMRAAALPECTVGPSDHLVAIRYHARVPRMKLLSLVIIFLCYQSAKLARMSSVIMTNSIVRSTAGMSAASKVIYSYPELRTGTLVTRYKRFLADIEFDTEMLSASPMTSLDSSS